MTPQEIRDEIDTRLAANWPTMAAKQGAWFAATGYYFQGLWTHAQAPEDGAEVAPDQLDLAPGYEHETWRDIGGLPDTMLSRLRIDNYRTPLQVCGFTVTSQVRIAGELWQKTLNIGPEADRNEPWHVVPEEA